MFNDQRKGEAVLGLLHGFGVIIGLQWYSVWAGGSGYCWVSLKAG